MQKNIDAIQQAFNGIVYAKVAHDVHAEVRAESRLFDVCLTNGMDFDEPDHIQWAASVLTQEWVSA